MPRKPKPAKGSAKNPARTRQKADRATPSGEPSPAFRICQLLSKRGFLTREQIARAVTVPNPKALQNALYNLRALERVALVDGVFAITDIGRTWCGTAGETTTTPPKPAKKARAQQAEAPEKTPTLTASVAPAPAGALTLTVMPPEAEPTFRCAIDSARRFVLRKGAAEIELTAPETLELLRYVDHIRGVAQPTPVVA